MKKTPRTNDLTETATFLGGLVKQGRLVWRLLRDARVPGWVKMVPFAGLLYFLSPIDLIPDWVLPGLGEIDDLVLMMLALKMFVDLSPASIVREHVDDLMGRRNAAGDTSSDPYIDVPYRVLNDGQKRENKEL
jgi:uncharacterized membrane protein YkvA (DUF1232 family)